MDKENKKFNYPGNLSRTGKVGFLKVSIRFAVFLLLFNFPHLVSATIYQPGQTLEPDCAPGFPNCGVDTLSSSLGTSTPIAGTLLSVQATSTNSILATLRAFAGQVANLFQVQNSSGANLFIIDASGAGQFSNTLSIANALTPGYIATASTTATSTFAGGVAISGAGQFSNTLSVANALTPGYIVTASTTATSTFAGGVAITGGGLRLNTLSSCHNLGTDSLGGVVCELGQYAVDVRKSADQSIVTSTTLTDDTELSFPIAANETWVFRFDLLYSTGAVPDLKLAVTAPTGAACDYAAGQFSQALSAGTTACGGVLPITGGTVNDEMLPIGGSVLNGGTAGTVHLQFAQNTSNATAVSILRGSTLSAFRVSGGADVGEVYYTKDLSLVSGMVVSIDPSLSAGVRLAKAPDEAMGIVSTKPGIVIGDTSGEYDGVPVIIALAGRVPVNVVTENGAIESGDYLVPSSVPGAAMKANGAGRVIGRAMSSFNGSDVGTVMAFVENSHLSQNMTNKVQTKELCLKKSDGSEICIDGDQLNSLIHADPPPPDEPEQ